MIRRKLALGTQLVCSYSDLTRKLRLDSKTRTRLYSFTTRTRLILGLVEYEQGGPARWPSRVEYEQHSGVKSRVRVGRYSTRLDSCTALPATMTINSFAEGGDGGAPSECDNKYHSDSEMVVALSTGWYNGGSRCLQNIKINANGQSILAKVVDECDSMNGCDSDHDYQPPCPNNIVDASPAVWKALGIPKSQIGDYDITWSDV